MISLGAKTWKVDQKLTFSLRSFLLILGAFTSAGFFSAGYARAALCDGTHPNEIKIDVPRAPSAGPVKATLYWTYQSPNDCKDYYNIRGGIIGRAEGQFESGSGHGCSPPAWCSHDVTLERDKPYAYSVQACHRRLLQSSECSQWSIRVFVLPHGPDTCKDGFVWREALANDHVCVVPQTRTAAQMDNGQAAARRSPNGGPFGPDTCVQGFVWREAIPTDHVCVTLQTRQQTREDNAAAASRLAVLL